MKQTSNPFDAWQVIVAAIALSAIGALFYNLLPMYVGVAQDSRQLSTQQAGLIGTAFFLGYNLVTVWAFSWIRRWNWRLVVMAALPVGAAGLLLAAFAPNYQILLLAGCMSGGGFAVLYGVATTVVADTSNPTRWYGFKIAAEVVPGVILLGILPSTLVATHGFTGITYGMLIAIAVMTLLLFGLPARGSIEHQTKPNQAAGEWLPRVNRWAVLLALLATFIFFTAASAIWTFIERIGNHSGFDADAVGALLAVNLLMAISGSLIAGALGDRFGNVKPFVAGILCLVLGNGLLGQLNAFGTYAAGSCIVNFGIGACVPFAVAEIARLDRDGRFVILSVPAIGSGAMLGPGLGGWLVDQFGFVTLLTCTGSIAIMAAAMMLYSGRLEWPEPARATGDPS